MIVTIDGPAGSGKSSTARAVARELGFLHLDSGALYRAFACVAVRQSASGPSSDALDAKLVRAAAGAAVEAEATPEGMIIRLEGRRLDHELRTPEVTACASRISTVREIRERVNDLLRELAARWSGGVVCEGRDMGTVVFPEAELKIYMTASLEERARRRLEQQGESVTPDRVSEEATRLDARDRADSDRDLSPLRPADDALVIDTTRLAFEEQVAQIVELARDRLDTSGGSR